MITLQDIARLRAQVAHWRAAGDRIGFVPTMGNLHQGHLELVRRARGAAQRVVVSVFVNPMQFGPGEDFNSYPRTLEQDRAKLAAEGVDLLFAPGVEAIYPHGSGETTRIEVPQVSRGLCADFRPGHFTGVATVVGRLFNLVQPDVAVFGEKDFQQLAVIRRMVEDLGWPVEIAALPTVREPDGLAMSSRNAYLSPTQRQSATSLHRALEPDPRILEPEATELVDVEDGEPFHDVRPLVYSIAPWLSAVTNLGLHRLPVGGREVEEVIERGLHGLPA